MPPSRAFHEVPAHPGDFAVRPMVSYRSSLKADKLSDHGTGMCSVPAMDSALQSCTVVMPGLSDRDADRVGYSPREHPAVRPRDHIIRRAGYRCGR